MDITIKISGSAGEGVQSLGDILTDGAALAGLHVFNFRSYGAEIRARGNSDATVRIAEKPITSLGRDLDVLVAVSSQASTVWAKSVKRSGVVIFDSHPRKMLSPEESVAAHLPPEVTLCGVPLTPISQELTGTSKAKNVAALGALTAILGLPKTKILKGMSGFWQRKGDAFVAMNKRVLQAGYDFALKHYSINLMKKVDFTARKALKVFSGNQALSKGLVDAGCTVFAGYPITPASPILEYAARELPKKGGKVIQTEDEIAAIGVVLGASFTGARAMTATSGPGFSLMVEQMGLAAMAEVPCVIVCVQRGGPSTGLPTKTEQSDLNLALFGGHGDAPRIVLAPTNVHECHTCMPQAFDFAQRYQTLVILLSDFFLANRRESVSQAFIKPKSKDTLVKPKVSELDPYQRFKITDSGISPMAIPGMQNGFYTTTGLEHDASGTPTYTGENHQVQTEKRFRKVKTALKEITSTEVIGPRGADIGILSWGSTTGAAVEAVALAKEAGIKVNVFKTRVLWPLPDKEIKRFVGRMKKVIIPEMNARGQLANLLHFVDQAKLVRANYITGEPVTPADIFNQVKKVNDVLSKES